MSVGSKSFGLDILSLFLEPKKSNIALKVGIFPDRFQMDHQGESPLLIWFRGVWISVVLLLVRCLLGYSLQTSGETDRENEAERVPLGRQFESSAVSIHAHEGAFHVQTRQQQY